MFEQAHKLSQKIPFWKTAQENPINQFVPSDELPYKESKLWMSDAEIAA